MRWPNRLDLSRSFVAACGVLVVGSMATTPSTSSYLYDLEKITGDTSSTCDRHGWHTGGVVHQGEGNGHDCDNSPTLLQSPPTEPRDGDQQEPQQPTEPEPPPTEPEQPEPGQPESGQPESEQPESEQPEPGQPEPGQPEPGQPPTDSELPDSDLPSEPEQPDPEQPDNPEEPTIPGAVDGPPDSTDGTPVVGTD